MSKDAETLKEQLKVMADKLKEAAAQLPGEDLVIEYDNGGGQSGIRENPFYSAYTKLLASYTKALSAFKDMAGEQHAEISSLEDLKASFKMVK